MISAVSQAIVPKEGTHIIAYNLEVCCNLLWLSLRILCFSAICSVNVTVTTEDKTLAVAGSGTQVDQPGTSEN